MEESNTGGRKEANNQSSTHPLNGGFESSNGIEGGLIEDKIQFDVDQPIISSPTLPSLQVTKDSKVLLAEWDDLSDIVRDIWEEGELTAPGSDGDWGEGLINNQIVRRPQQEMLLSPNCLW